MSEDASWPSVSVGRRRFYLRVISSLSLALHSQPFLSRTTQFEFKSKMLLYIQTVYVKEKVKSSFGHQHRSERYGR